MSQIKITSKLSITPRMSFKTLRKKKNEPRCQICGKKLKDEASKLRGIGPEFLRNAPVMLILEIPAGTTEA